MNPNDALLWTHTPPKRVPKPGETLFEFQRASDGAPITIELRFHGESYGWEVQVLERGELFFAHGAWVTRAAAIAWAEGEGTAILIQSSRCALHGWRRSRGDSAGFHARSRR